ncbi:MAG: aldo/keto reductase [Nitrospina sp.]|nr:aldo/keto reductase [Nitrospina sp.]
MEYRRFGKTEEKISVITLGGMRFKHGWTPPRNHLPKDSIENCISTTRMALDLGINHIETAHGYMKSELLFGHALKELGVPRNKFKIMTKGAPMSGDETRRLVEEQLKALNLDYIDFYGWHGINNKELLKVAVEKNGPVETLYQLKNEGLIRHIGFSTHGPLSIIMEAMRTNLFSFINLHYYYFFQHNLPAVKLAGEMDMGVFIISPNEKGGMLFKPSEKVKNLCTPITPIAFNGRFCLSHSEITTLSMGMHEPKHFSQNLAILNGGNYFNSDLSKVKSAMDAPLEKITDLCTLCNECLPCPENINIPEVLRFRNLNEGYDMLDYGRFRYNMFEGQGHWFPGTFAFHCTECGDCLPRCPEDLNIPKLLMETHKKLFNKSEYLKQKLLSFIKSILKTLKLWKFIFN